MVLVERVIPNVEKPREWTSHFRAREDLPFLIALEILQKSHPEFSINLEARNDDAGEYLVASGTRAGNHAFITVCGDDIFRPTVAIWAKCESARHSDTGKKFLEIWKSAWQKFEESYGINLSRFTKRLPAKPELILYPIITNVVKRQEKSFLIGINRIPTIEKKTGNN